MIQGAVDSPSDRAIGERAGSMAVYEPTSRALPAATAELRAAEEAYRELKRTWDTFERRWAEALPDIIATRKWTEWLGTEELARLRAVLGEWVVAGDNNPEHERQAGIALSHLGPRMVRLIPPELRASYARAAELSLYLIEQMSVVRGVMPANLRSAACCACGVGVATGSACVLCNSVVCVLHSLPHPLRDDGARICQACLEGGR
jgi:hypothetical protein